jgi:hypothetical protein
LQVAGARFIAGDAIQRMLSKEHIDYITPQLIKQFTLSLHHHSIFTA